MLELIDDLELCNKFDFDALDVARQVVRTVLMQQNCPYEDPLVSLTLCENDDIHNINLDTRGVDAPTDVLSFPNLEFDAPGEFTAPAQLGADYIDPLTDRVILGDIVLNTERVFSQAEEYGHSVKREFAFLIAHSMMHLCGYDHMSEDEAMIMEAGQEAALKHLNITRD